MKNKLINFLPPIVQDIKEFKEFTTVEDVELDSIESGQRRILNEAFIDTATEYGIKKYEFLYKIKADIILESMEFRRLRVKNRGLDKIPFTFRVLRNKLESLFGSGNFSMEVDSDNYTLNIEITSYDWNMFNEIMDNFRYIIPCNILLKSMLIQKVTSPVYFGSSIVSGEEVTVYPWTPEAIESIGKINIAIGNGVGIENITVYPKEE